MPSSDPHPPAEPELAWLLHSALVWALTGALLTMARRPLWSAVGVVLTVLGLGMTGWVVRRRQHRHGRSQTGSSRIAAAGQVRGLPAVKEGAMSGFRPDPESGGPPRASSVSIPLRCSSPQGRSPVERL